MHKALGATKKTQKLQDVLPEQANAMQRVEHHKNWDAIADSPRHCNVRECVSNLVHALQKLGVTSSEVILLCLCCVGGHLGIRDWQFPIRVLKKSRGGERLAWGRGQPPPQILVFSPCQSQ